jgi:hypothetical protein
MMFSAGPPTSDKPAIPPDGPVEEPANPAGDDVPVEEPPNTSDAPTREPPAGPDDVEAPMNDPRVPGQPTRKEAD